MGNNAEPLPVLSEIQVSNLPRSLWPVPIDFCLKDRYIELCDVFDITRESMSFFHVTGKADLISFLSEPTVSIALFFIMLHA